MNHLQCLVMVVIWTSVVIKNGLWFKNESDDLEGVSVRTAKKGGARTNVARSRQETLKMSATNLLQPSRAVVGGPMSSRSAIQLAPSPMVRRRRAPDPPNNQTSGKTLAVSNSSAVDPLAATHSLHTDMDLYTTESSHSLTAVDGLERVSSEQMTFTNWVNDRLKPGGKLSIRHLKDGSNLRRVGDLRTDLCDGVILIKLLENLTKKKIKGYEKSPKLTAHKMVNLDLVFQFLQRESIKVIGIGSQNIFNGDLTLILGLIWTLIQKYQLRMLGTHVSTKLVMVQWLQAQLPTWNINNLTSDWSDGRALVALINEVKPGVAPDVSTLDPTKRRNNCVLGLKVAQDHLKIPKLISAEDLSNSRIDELSIITYLSYFVEPAKAKLLKWVKKQLAPVGITVSNFTSDWSDGRALAALTESRFEGLLPESLSASKYDDPVGSIQQVLDTCKKRLGIEPIFKAGQLVNTKVEELQLMTYLLRLKTGKLKALPDEIRVTGNGLHKATTFKTAQFEINTSQAGPGRLSIDAYYENGDKVKFTFSETSPAVALITYTPPTSGVIHFDILWSDTPVPNSPFTISVTDSTLVRFIDFEHHSRLARVHIPITLSLQTKDAGPGSLSASLDYSDETKIKAIVKRQPNSVHTLTYTPTKAGKPSLRVFWNGEELRHLSIPYTIVDSGNYQVVERPEKKVYGTFESSSFTVQSDGAPLDVLQMTAFLGDIQIPIRFKLIDGSRGEASFTPTLPGVYRVEVACVDKLVEGSPFRVEVSDPSQCKPLGLLPKYLKLGFSHRFEVDMKNAGVGKLEFVSADGGGTMPFHTATLPLSKDGIQALDVTPQKSGEYLVGIKFHGAFIPSSPFRVTVCDPNKCRASGEVITKKASVVGKPLQFKITIMGQGEGIKPTVKAAGPSAKYSAEVRTTVDHSYSVQFIPWEIGTHEITVQYGGFSIPKSPFLIAVTGFDSKGISATGSGLQEAFTGVPAQFVVLTKQDGLLEDGTLQIKVNGVVNNLECKVRARDNKNGTYNVAYLTQLPGAYLVSILGGGHHIPGSPFRLTAHPGPDAENCYMFGPALEPATVLTIGKPIDFTVNASEGGKGTLTVKAVGPGGAEARVYMAKADKKGSYDIMLDPVRHGKYRVSVKWSGKHIQGSPFLLKVFPGADASKCRAHGPGLEDGFVGKASSFTIETRDAGAGTLKVRLHGVKDAFKIDIKPIDQRDVRTLVARYDPRKPGEYLVTIKWSEIHVPGSPFRVKIKGEALTKADIEELTATPRHNDLNSIQEESEEEEEGVLEKPEQKKAGKKRKKNRKPKQVLVPVPVMPLLVPVMDPRLARQHYRNTFMRGGTRQAGHTVSGAGMRGPAAENMMVFNGMRSSGRLRQSTPAPTAQQGEYHGQANIQMNTVSQRELKRINK